VATQKYKYLIKNSDGLVVVKTNCYSTAVGIVDNGRNDMMLIEILPPIRIGRKKFIRTKILRRITNQLELM
jgi:hypothetical protein